MRPGPRRARRLLGKHRRHGVNLHVRLHLRGRQRHRRQWTVPQERPRRRTAQALAQEGLNAHVRTRPSTSSSRAWCAALGNAAVPRPAATHPCSTPADPEIGQRHLDVAMDGPGHRHRPPGVHEEPGEASPFATNSEQTVYGVPRHPGRARRTPRSSGTTSRCGGSRPLRTDGRSSATSSPADSACRPAL